MVEASEILLGADRARMGEKLWLSFQKNHPDCTHEVEIRLGDRPVEVLRDLGSGFLWQIPDYTPQCPDCRVVSCSLHCSTYLKGQYLGKRVAFLTLDLPEPVYLRNEKLVLGQSAQLLLSPRARGYTLTLALMLGELYTPIGEVRGEEPVTWVPPLGLGAEFPELVKTEAVLRCFTYNGREEIGMEDRTVLLEVPDIPESRPQIRSLTLTPLGEDLPSPFPRYFIRGKTGVRAQAQVQAPLSPVESLTLRAGGRTAPGGTLEIPLLETSGQVAVTVTARDRRGFVSETTRTIQVLPYEKPRIVPWGQGAEVICQRASALGQLTPEGTFLAIRAGIRFSPLKAEGLALNRCMLRMRCRAAEEPQYGSWTTLLGLDDPGKEISALLSDLVTDPERSYRVELQAEDLLRESHSLEFSIMTRAVSFALYDGVDGAAFGKFPEEPHVVDLASHMTLRVRGKLEVLGETWVDLGLSSAVDPSVYPRGRLGTSGCRYRVNGGSRVCICFNCALKALAAPVQVSLEPLPQALRPGQPIMGICACQGGMAAVRLDPDGQVFLEGITAPEPPGWVDGWLEYLL